MTKNTKTIKENIIDTKQKKIKVDTKKIKKVSKISDIKTEKYKKADVKKAKVKEIFLSKKKKTNTDEVLPNQERVEKENIIRYSPDTKTGLNQTQIEKRKAQGLTNVSSVKTSKSLTRIFADNILTFFNLICVVVFVALVMVGSIRDCIFMIVVLLNTMIGIVQEIKAKNTIEKLTLTNSNFTKVVRDGQQIEIYKKEVVLDDILYLASGMQIASDSIIIDGQIEVNESLLTGESLPIKKGKGDTLMAGSFVSSGTCYARVEKIGNENYIERLASRAKSYSQPKSELMFSLRFVIKMIGIIIIPLGILMFFNNQEFYNGDLYLTVTKTAGSIIGMIPAGMFLLTSVALAVGVIRLAKKRTLVQELYCIEMLARANVLCLDKTGTLTDGSMKVRELLSLNQKFSEKDTKKIISSIVCSFHENNHTAQAIKSYFGSNCYYNAEKTIPFSSERKYMGCKFKSIGSFKIGAYEYVCKSDIKLEKLANSYAEKGMRVLALVQTDNIMSQNKGEAIAFILLQDNIRKDAQKTIEWFKQNAVDIKVISGDNPMTVSEIARRVGIDNYEKYISLQGMNKQEVIASATEYTVFGRVSPEQKAILVRALKANGKTVAMTGDGVNDILALKEADCSIAIAAGSDAARSVSHLVLLDSNFSSMPNVVAEGRRVVNNIQKSSSLFLMKTIFTILISILVLIFNRNYPFSPIQFMLLETFIIGLPSFFLALQPNYNIIQGKFISNILKAAFPAGLVLILNMIAIYVYQDYTGVSTDVLVTMASIAVTAVGLIILYTLCKPFNLPKVVLLGSMIIACVLCIAIMPSFFGYVALTLENILFIMVTILLSYPLYMIFNRSLDYIKF